tara:strand:+ start:143 stop:262 length:120 start_codon:yes stop_codon:yes gene_type:complete
MWARERAQSKTPANLRGLKAPNIKDLVIFEPVFFGIFVL